MSDIFISYARSTEAAAQCIAERLAARGYAVWRDDQLPAHRAYGEVIEERLRLAKAVVVAWSVDAAKSQWVRAEADVARQAGTLVQLSLDGVVPPLPFNQIQCADLKDWSGDETVPGWETVLRSIADLMAGGAPPTPTRLARGGPALAVLAFDNLSADPEMTYFSDGVSEEILQTVARTSDLTVIARSSSFQFRGPAKSTRRIAMELGVTHLLDGSVRRSGERVRITAQLVDCASETTLWSNRFDRDLSDVFALQDEIAAAVAQALKIAFAPSSAVAPIDPVAFDLYLRARTLAIDVNEGACIELLEQAVARSPRFAAAWASLCRARAAQARHGPRPKPFEVLRAGAIEAASTALELDPKAGLAYAALSTLKPMGLYQAREHLLRKAVSVAPGEPETLAAMGAFCNHVGATREAVDFLKHAYALDPLYPQGANYYGAVLWSAGRFEESRALYEIWRHRWPEHLVFTVGPLNGATAEHDWARFDQLARAGRAIAAEDPILRASVRIGEAMRSGDAAFPIRIAHRMERHIAEDGAPPLHLLVTASQFGLKEAVFAAIDRSNFGFMFDESGPDPAGRYNPGIIFDASYSRALMEDVRFVGLCAKLGLCDYWIQADRWPDCAEPLSAFYDFKAAVRRLAT